MRIALDAMGGDLAPEAPVRGALRAVEEHDVEVVLVGDEDALAPELDEAGEIPPRLHVHHASEVVEMEDHPSSALRRKRRSSLRVAFELVRSGEADAVVSAGHTGAALAMGIFVLERLPGILRPAVAVVFPTTFGPVVLLDAGANVDCRPELLAQFATLGSVFAEVGLDMRRPRIGLLSNGIERDKGTELVRRAHALIGDLPLNYRGYVEGTDMVGGVVDVVVTDGFTGNVVLKVAEGIAGQVEAQIQAAARESATSLLGAALMRGAFRKTRRTMDQAEVGGALLLGVQGCVVISHGRADERALAHALAFAGRSVEQGLNDRIREAVTRRAGR